MANTRSRSLFLLEGALILTLAALAASSHLPTVRAQPYYLSVRCVDGSSASLPGVNVTVTKPGDTWSDLTDSFGMVTFTGLLVDSYTIRAQYKNTLVTTYGPFSLQSDRIITLNCTVYDWVITVLDFKGNETIVGAKVSIQSLMTSDSSTSDPSGRAGFYRIPQGTYVCVVRYEGFKIADKTLYLGMQNQQDSISTNMLDLIVSCLDVSERPAVGVTLKLWNSTDALVGEVQTGLNGQAKFKNLPGAPTQYRAEALFQGKSIGSLDPFTLSSDGLLKTMSLQLARLTLTVKDFNGVNVMSDLDLMASAYLEGKLVVESLSTTGNIDLGSLVLETYSINVTFGNVTVASFSHKLTKESQQRTVNADFYDVTAKVDASDLLNSAQAQNLRMRLEYGGFLAESPVGANGEAFFQDVPPATCNLTLFKGGTPVGSKLVAVSSQGQLLPPMKPTTYTLSLKVVNADLEPLTCSLRLVETGGIPVSTLESNQSGVAVFPGILGLTYDVTVTSKGIEVGRQNMQVSRDTFFLIVAKVYRIAVTLTDYEGSTSIQGASIEATAPNLLSTETRLTDSQGKAIFADMPKADYLLTARFMNVKVSTALLTLSSDQNMTFPSPGIYDMTVRCVDADGNPLKMGEAQVLLAGKEVGREYLDEDGSAQFFDLPNTTYEISAFLYEEQVGSASVALETQGQVVQVETQASALRIRLYAADNTTLVDANVTVLKEGRRIASKTPSPTDHRTSFTLPVGSYRVLVYYQDTSVSDTIKTHYSSEDVEIPCTVYKCQVKAIDLQHEPIQGVQIHISKDSEAVLSTTTNSSGLAEFYLAGGQRTWRIVMPGRTSSATMNTERNLQILLLNVQDQPSLAAAAAAGGAIALLLLAVSLYLRRRTKIGTTGVREKRYRPRVPRI